MNFLRKNKISRIISKYHYFFPFIHRNKHIEIDLYGGLCNKLHCLFSACEIAIERNCVLVEPYFGWKDKILFSEIFDMDYFNDYMRRFTKNNTSIMVDRNYIKKQNIRVQENIIHLWKYASMKTKKEQNQKAISLDSTKIHVLRALILKPEYLAIVQENTNMKSFTSLQVRTESDWVAYSKLKKSNVNGESILVSKNEIIAMLKKFDVLGELFFTSGENHNTINQDLNNVGFKNHYFFDPELEYEVNAAINFEICCKADVYIGLSRSSYSNLISLKRAAILNNDNSYIYNYKSTITKRQDKGLFDDAKKSIKCYVTLMN